MAQSDGTSSPATHYLGYDGHGSTRILTDSGGVIASGGRYNYDAYGVSLGSQPSTPNPSLTSLLYTGEQFDLGLQQYYLRARYYNQSTGRFNQIDLFAGAIFDPQSLHKYAYAHSDPINAIDPSGLEAYAIPGLVAATGIITTLAAVLFRAILIAAGYAIYDLISDLFRINSFLLHVRDATLVKLAKRFNNGALLTALSPPMFFTPLFPDAIGVANHIALQVGIALQILTGLYDVNTQLAINSFISEMGMTPLQVAAIDPSLTTPSRRPVLVVSGAQGGLAGRLFFQGGIRVRFEFARLSFFRFFSKSVVTLPGETVAQGKYWTIDPFGISLGAVGAGWNVFTSLFSRGEDEHFE